MCKNVIVVNSITTKQNNQEKAIVFTNETMGNSITPSPQNQSNESIYDDARIPSMEQIDKLLLEYPRLEDPSAPFIKSSSFA